MLEMIIMQKLMYKNHKKSPGAPVLSQDSLALDGSEPLKDRDSSWRYGMETMDILGTWRDAIFDKSLENYFHWRNKTKK